MRLADERWDALRNRGRIARLQLGVALDAAGQRLFELESEFGEDLTELTRHVIVADEDCSHDSGLDHPTLCQITIARQQHAALGRSLANEPGVADSRVIGGVVSEGPQPAGEPPDVAVGKEPKLHPCNLRIGCVAAEDLMARLRSEAGGCYSWSSGPGDRYAEHSHEYQKVLYCVEGSITFVLASDGRSLELKSGDRIALPAGTVHSARVGPDGCTCIEGRGESPP